MNGTIARLIRDRGFGFITGADGREYFFHRSSMTDVRATFDQLNEHDRVEFTVSKGEKGLRAEDVARV